MLRSVLCAFAAFWHDGVGPLSGKTIWTVIFFLASRVILGLALRNRDLDLKKVTIATVVLLGLALVGTFSPFFELFKAD